MEVQKLKNKIKEVIYIQEIWKDVKEYEGIYTVSNTGKIKSLDRKIQRSDGAISQRLNTNKKYHGLTFQKI